MLCFVASRLQSPPLSLSRFSLAPLLRSSPLVHKRVRRKRQHAAQQDNSIQAHARRRAVRRRRRRARSSAVVFRLGVSFLCVLVFLASAQGLGLREYGGGERAECRMGVWMWGKGRREKRRTCRFKEPTSMPSRISRASSEWPTSSNASVESWPATSRRTSSPPLERGAVLVFFFSSWFFRGRFFVSLGGAGGMR